MAMSPVTPDKIRNLRRNTPLSTGATLVGKGRELDGVPEVGQSLNEAALLPFFGAGIEVAGAEVLVHRSVFEHVIDGREDRGGDRHNRLRRLRAGAGQCCTYPLAKRLMSVPISERNCSAARVLMPGVEQ